MRQLFALAVGVLAAATLAQSAFAGGDSKTTLGPSGYEPHGKSTLVLAGTANVVLGSEDHVVICHAIGGSKGSDFNQIAPVAHGHGSHEGDRDIIPPFVYESKKGDKDASLASGNNWSAATAAIYANGCSAPAQTTPTPPAQQDVCPNIEGVQTVVPSGLTKDASGNCVATTTTTTTTIVQSAPPAQTVVVEKVVVEKVVVHVTIKAAKKAKKAKKAHKAKKVKKAKKIVRKHKAKHAQKKARIQVKGVRKAFTSGVLPHTR
jgi:hypothetical protein